MTPFPGFAAVPPCLGAALFIASNEGRPTVFGRLFSLKPIVFIGAISYSLYLWHWPIFSYSRYLFGLELTTSQTIWAIVWSLVFATLSWRFVEVPFRAKNFMKTRVRVFLFGFVVTFIMLATSVGIWKFGDDLFFSGEKSQSLLEDVNYVGAQYRAGDRKQVTGFEFRLIGSPFADKPAFLLWGDSHALVLARSLDAASTEFGISGVVAAHPAVIPVTGVNLPLNLDLGNQQSRFNNEVLGLIQKQGFESVIITARWSLYIEGFSPMELVGHPERTKLKLLISDDLSQNVSPEKSAEALRVQLKATAVQLVERGVQRIWILKQIPEQRDVDIARKWLLSRRLPGFVLPSDSPVTYSVHLLRQARVNKVLEQISKEIPQVSLVDPSEYCFDANGVSFLSKDGFSCYRDNNHLSRNGVNLLLGPLIRKTLLEIKGAVQ